MIPKKPLHCGNCSASLTKMCFLGPCQLVSFRISEFIIGAGIHSADGTTQSISVLFHHSQCFTLMYDCPLVRSNVWRQVFLTELVEEDPLNTVPSEARTASVQTESISLELEQKLFSFILFYLITVCMYQFYYFAHI